MTEAATQPQTGTLFVVATPIGNLGDLTPRALQVLGSVQAILAEDTRRTRKLLAFYGLATPLWSFHEHNERTVLSRVLRGLQGGKNFALVSDAGTPLLCDPGFRLVRACRERGLAVAAVPGPSAITAALSVAGLPPYPFTFLGFLPAKTQGRQHFLQRFAALEHTLVMFLSPHRLSAELADCREVLGPQREAALLAELSKANERCLWGSLGSLAGAAVTARGEFTLVVGPPQAEASSRQPTSEQARALMADLQAQGLSLAEARQRAARTLGISRRALYQLLQAAKREA
ncbi:MAG: 16S rRNA (cytidine(1402)-2'-O)-methyltransferase [Thermoanaerobaculum sp.]|nr:16S rRNA (cytidine(1402)-2'-O)-methyltransferase [Thermoanaerobaculum sp.]MDW7966682.1 16S rRNA (cytidine(1402)-2'-O)-methyltransferase [Thermoanaerobaculum sp.]